MMKSKGANLCLKCSKIRLAAGLRPDPLGELIRSPRLHSRNGGLTLRRGTACGIKGPRFEYHRGRSCLSRWLLRYAALGMGCALLQCPGQLSLASLRVAKSSTRFGWGKGGNSALPGGRQHWVIWYGMWVPVAAWPYCITLANRYTAFTYLRSYFTNEFAKKMDSVIYDGHLYRATFVVQHAEQWEYPVKNWRFCWSKVLGYRNRIPLLTATRAIGL